MLKMQKEDKSAQSITDDKKAKSVELLSRLNFSGQSPTQIRERYAAFVFDTQSTPCYVHSYLHDNTMLTGLEQQRLQILSQILTDFPVRVPRA